MAQAQRLVQTLYLIQDKRRWPTRGSLWVQAGELGQQEAVVLCDGLFGGGGCQVALKGKDLLPLRLRDLQLSVDHLGFGLLISHCAWRVRVVVCHNHLHEHFQSGVTIPRGQTNFLWVERCHHKQQQPGLPVKS